MFWLRKSPAPSGVYLGKSMKKVGKSVWLGEMETILAIFVLLPQTAAANKATECVGVEP
jgi:hypothetical protein